MPVEKEAQDGLSEEDSPRKTPGDRREPDAWHRPGAGTVTSPPEASARPALSADGVGGTRAPAHPGSEGGSSGPDLPHFPSD